MATNLPDLSLGVGARSEKGRREENQDKMTAFPTSLGTVYIVADGMGGHRGGAEASHLVIEGYRKHLTSFQEGAGLPDVLQAATVLTNAEILEAGHSGDPAVAGMGSTVVMAVLRTGANGMEMLTGHIGDSRAYLLRSGSLHRLTRDHSAVQRMVDAQILTPEAARSHPDSNVLTRALGQQPNVVIDVSMPEPLLPGDTLLLCSDGLWGYVPDEQLQHELSLDRSASEAADALADLALEQGSDDNITLQVLRLEDRQRTMRAPEVLRQTEVDGLALAAVAAPGGNSAGKRAKLSPGS
jgi:PPM family protein phosphatase